MKNFLNNNEDSRLNEIIFENRNKEYGAYALRRDENAILTKSFLIGISFVSALALTPVILNSFKSDAVIVDPAQEPFIFKDVREVEQVPDKQQPVSAPKKVETFNSTLPNPKKTVEKEMPAPKVVQYKDAAAGFENSEGDKKENVYTPPVAVPGPLIAPVPVPVKPIEKPVEDPNAVVDKVDVKANFAGGLEAFRTKVGENMDVSEFAGSGERITANVTFIVEKDGSITNIKASGKDSYFNREAERAVKAVRGKWTAAKVKGNAVRSYFNIPVTIQFE